MITILAAAIAALAAPTTAPARAHEGDWYVSDHTDNNTGQREVYAFQNYFPQRETGYVTITLRCSSGKPTFFFEWSGLDFPDQAVLTIGPVTSADVEPTEQRYVLEKSTDAIERGLRASPETSATIVSALGQAKYATFTAHLSSGARTVGVDVGGTQRAWSRVSRHCPVRVLPQPPL